MAVDIPTAVDAVIAAINRGDTDAFLGLFTDDGVVDDFGSIYSGYHEIAEWNARELIGAKGQLTVKRTERLRERIVVTGDWKSTFHTGPSRMEFSVRGDKVSLLRILPA
ncbi:MAG: nuclear transport factor 2 family protein [Bauldia sp.]|nr:nuclear transport factor 2 family protein [Bauldia sp.]